MIIKNPLYKKLKRTAPLMTLGLLLLLPLFLPNGLRVDASALSRQHEVATAVADVPYRIGSWASETVPIPTAAEEMLRPNAVLSRRFTPFRGDGPQVELLVVHCTDVRDMRGHYPEGCYPSHGWLAGDRRNAEITVRGRSVPLRVYTFERIEGGGLEERIRVLSVFVLPDGTLTPDHADITRRSERLALATQGVAQIQILTALEVDEDVALRATTHILEGMPGLLAALGIVEVPDEQA